MKYQKVSSIVDEAWAAFYKKMDDEGFTEEQVVEFAEQLNYADVFSAVEKCAMEAVR